MYYYLNKLLQLLDLRPIEKRKIVNVTVQSFLCSYQYYTCITRKQPHLLDQLTFRVRKFSAFTLTVRIFFLKNKVPQKKKKSTFTLTVQNFSTITLTVRKFFLKNKIPQ